MKQNVVYDKSKEFALRIIKMCDYLMNERKDYIMSNQIFRSGTSIGANIAESQNAQSGADFIHKMSIALKEADETGYWLELLYRSGRIDEPSYNSVNSDCVTIRKMLTTIIKKRKESLEMVSV